MVAAAMEVECQVNAHAICYRTTAGPPIKADCTFALGEHLQEQTLQEK